MTQGFITIATGKRQYYELAANLLKSYRYFSDNPLPFAIIAEEENELTALFDEVIIVKEPERSFMDKFLIMKLCPYDETVFIDADSLAFGDLNAYFDYFKDATDFTAIGTNNDLSDNNIAWFNISDIGEYGDKIAYKCHVHAGVMFVRKSEKLDKLYADSMDIYENIDKLHFISFEGCYDECILGISMPMNGMKAKREDPKMIAFFPCLSKVKADIFSKKLCYETPWAGYTEGGILLHYATQFTHLPEYVFNAECLNMLIAVKNRRMTFKEKILYKYKLRLFTMKADMNIKRLFRFLKRAFGKLRR